MMLRLFRNLFLSTFLMSIIGIQKDAFGFISLTDRGRSQFPLLKAVAENRPLKVKIVGLSEFGYDYLRNPVNSRIDLSKQDETLKKWITRAMRTWMAPLRMFGNFKPFNEVNYVSGGSYDVIIYVQSQMEPAANPTSSYNRACRARMRADNDTDCYESFYNERNYKLHFRTHKYKVLLHELGHAFALGDTYGDNASSHPDSVMKLSHYSEFFDNGLYSDDTQGVLYAYCRQGRNLCGGFNPRYQPRSTSHHFWLNFHKVHQQIEGLRVRHFRTDLSVWQSDYRAVLANFRRYNLYNTYNNNWPDQADVLDQLDQLSSDEFTIFADCMYHNHQNTAPMCLNSPTVN